MLRSALWIREDLEASGLIKDLLISSNDIKSPAGDVSNVEVTSRKTGPTGSAGKTSSLLTPLNRVFSCTS